MANEAFIAIHWISQFDKYSWPGQKYGYGKHMLRIEYESMNVKIRSEVPMVDFNTFVSAVGGSLGLFLGFSLIGSLFYVYNFIQVK